MASIRAVNGRTRVAYEVRWRDENRAHRSKTFKTRKEAEAFAGQPMTEDAAVAAAALTATEAPEPPQRHDGRTALYRHYSASGELLYVGIAADIGQRTRSHMHGSGWMADVDHSYVRYYETRTLAEVAEVIAIRTESPKHNRIRYTHITPDAHRRLMRNDYPEIFARWDEEAADGLPFSTPPWCLP